MFALTRRDFVVIRLVPLRSGGQLLGYLPVIRRGERGDESVAEASEGATEATEMIRVSVSSFR